MAIGYLQPSSCSALAVDAYTCSESPGLLGHIFTGIFWSQKRQSCDETDRQNINGKIVSTLPYAFSNALTISSTVVPRPVPRL